MSGLNSMTGYGEGRAEDERVRVTLSIRTVNHRFLDLSIRLPDAYRGFEMELGSAIKKRLSRGRVEVRIRVDPVAEPQLTVQVRRSVAEGYRRAAEELGSSGAGALTPAELLRLPEVAAIQAPVDEAGDPDRALLLAAAEEALAEVVLSRQREGSHLESVLRDRLGELAGQRRELAAGADEIQSGLAAALEQRLSDLLGDRALEPGRLAQEVAILADRSDVREELDRLSGHLDAFDKLLDGDGERGKRMDFLSQEILRELNTLGAKCRHSQQLERVVEAKVLCEQLREQVQNVE